MDHITVRQAAERWNVSIRRVQQFCGEGRISGAVLFGRDWMIPKDAPKPADGRKTRYQKQEKP